MTRAVVLHFGRQSMGEACRTDSWVRLLTGAGMDVTKTALVANGHPRRPRLSPSAVSAMLGGRAVPEALAWSAADVVRQLRRDDPDVVVCQTARAYQPSLVDDSWVTVLDFVDQLSESYRQRAAITHSRSGELGYRVLQGIWERFERRPTPDRVRRVAAGWTDAKHLDAEWLPILVGAPTPARPVATAPTHDIVFFGTLDYLPNVDAIDRLARITRLVDADHRPSVLVAGRNASEHVVGLVAKQGWTLRADYANVTALAATARLAVAPMTSTAGMQIKVLEAAAAGLAQVASPEAVAGFEPGLPIAVAGTDREFAQQISRLLADDRARSAQADAARAAITRHYTVGAWVDWARGLLD